MKLRMWMRRKLFPARLARDIDEELRFHLDMRTEEYSGEGRRAARRKALRRFGDVDAVTAACRAAHKIPANPENKESAMRGLIHDALYSIRYLMRRPIFSVVAIGTLALGIGTTTTIFSMVNSVLLNPMPFEGGDDFAFLWRQVPNGAFRVTSGDHALFWESRARSFDRMASFSEREFNLEVAGEISQIAGAFVSPSLLGFLGLEPVAGRGFVAADTSAGNHVVMLSEGYWRRHFGADPGILNSEMILNDSSYTIVGVVPQRSNFFWRDRDPKDVWVAAAPGSGFNIVAHLAPGVTVDQAQLELSAIEETHEEDAPRATLTPVALRPGETTSGDVRRGLWTLFGGVGLLLLIVCANVANLFLTQGLSRAHELAIRNAVGASRPRILGQLAVETFVLVASGAVIGAALSWTVLETLGLWIPEDLRILSSVELDAQALLFVGGVAALISVFLALAPAGLMIRLNAGEMLTQGGRAASLNPLSTFARKLLVTAEVALALTLFVGSGLLVKSLVLMNQVDPGVRAETLLSGSINLPSGRYQNEESITAALHEIVARIEQLPQVREVAEGSLPPRFGISSGTVQETDVEVISEERQERQGNIRMNLVSDNYFSATGTRLLAGSGFTPENRAIEGAIIVNDGFARMFWPKGEALGKRFRMGPTSWKTIVGVAANVPAFGLRDDPTEPQQYVPRSTIPVFPSMDIIISTVGDPAAVIPLIRDQVLGFDRKIPPPDLQPALDRLSQSIARPRFTTILLSSFAWIAVALAILGVYGVIALTVSQRTRELGIRIALGAERGQVVRLMMRHTMGPMIAGVGVGLAGSLALTGFLEKMLFDVTPTDTATFLTVTVVLIGTALLASYFPARRAAEVDPTEALRAE